MEGTSLICPCSVQYHCPSPLPGLQCGFLFLLHLFGCFIVPSFWSQEWKGYLGSSAWKASRKQYFWLDSDQLPSGSEEDIFLGTNQKYPCGKLINVPLLGSGEEGPWDSTLSISSEPFFFFFLRQICVFNNTAECLHEERTMLKSVWRANSWVHKFDMCIYT